MISKVRKRGGQIDHVISWISPLGKALLAADMGGWIKLDDGRSAKIVKTEQDKEPPKTQSAQ